MVTRGCGARPIPGQQIRRDQKRAARSNATSVTPAMTALRPGAGSSATSSTRLRAASGRRRHSRANGASATLEIGGPRRPGPPGAQRLSSSSPGNFASSSMTTTTTTTSSSPSQLTTPCGTAKPPTPGSLKQTRLSSPSERPRPAKSPTPPVPTTRATSPPSSMRSPAPSAPRKCRMPVTSSRRDRPHTPCPPSSTRTVNVALRHGYGRNPNQSRITRVRWLQLSRRDHKSHEDHLVLSTHQSVAAAVRSINPAGKRFYLASPMR